MPRRPNIDRPTKLTLKLPESLRTRLDLLLYSELEGRVPQGRYQQFFSDRIREYFTWRTLDLGLFGLPQGYFVSGPLDMVEALKRHLGGKSATERTVDRGRRDDDSGGEPSSAATSSPLS